MADEPPLRRAEVIEESAAVLPPEKGTSRKQKKSRGRAKQWTYYVETLKTAVDGLYEVCREEQSLAGCKEALMYLQTSSRDFESLISSINVELEWEKEPEKPQAVAWEVRKTMSSPGAEHSAAAALIDALPIAPLMFSEVVKAAGARRAAGCGASPVKGGSFPVPVLPPRSPVEEEEARKENEEAATALPGAGAEEWQVVVKRRRRSVSSLTDDSSIHGGRPPVADDDRMDSSLCRVPSANVYERLSSTTGRYPSSERRHSTATPTAMTTSTTTATGGSTGRGGGMAGASGMSASLCPGMGGLMQGNYMYPRSAMDLPQTKASMAKMAYSRQLLWQRSQSSLMEKMKARHARYRNVDFAGAGGVPQTRRPRSARSGGTEGSEGGGRGHPRAAGGSYQRKSSTPLSSEPDRSLGSIREQEHEEGLGGGTDPRGEEIPSDPKPSHETKPTPPASPRTTPRKVPATTGGTMNAWLRRRPASPPSLAASLPAVRRATISHQPAPLHRDERSTRSLGGGGADDAVSLLSSLPVDDEVVDLEADAEWREMTEEEESLAFEERSLNIEIEQEQNLSIDAELERQVAAEAAELERLERLREEEEAARRESEEAARMEAEAAVKKAEEDAGPVDFVEIVKKWEQDMKEFATVSWAELMEKEYVMKTAVPTHLREPGEAAARHERMLSPSRRRCDKDDSDFSRRHGEKLKRAEELREKLLADKAARLKNLIQRVEEVREAKAAVLERKRAHMEMRMQRVEEKRRENLGEIVRRAREDEQRVLEVQLCNSMEKDNARHQHALKEREGETRRQTMAEERARKLEEKAATLAANQAAAEERRKVVEEKKRENEERRRVEEGDEREGGEEEEERRRIHDWSLVLDGMLTRLPSDDATSDAHFECTACSVELPTAWDAIVHCTEARKHADAVYETATPEALHTELRSFVRRARPNTAESTRGLDTVSNASSARPRKATTNGKKSKKKGGGGGNKAAAQASRLAKESAEGLARAIGGRHGPSFDAWRSLFASVETRLVDEDALREVQLYGKGAKAKSSCEALAAFLDEYAREEPCQNSELILLTTVDAALRGATAEWRRVDEEEERRKDEAREGGKSHPIFPVGPAEECTLALLEDVCVRRPAVLERLMSSGVRELRVATLLLRRIASEASSPLRPATNHRRTVADESALATSLTVLGGLARMGTRHQLLLCTLLAPTRLASFPIASFTLPSLRVQLVPVVIAVTSECDQATVQLARTLSPRHCIQFLTSLSPGGSLAELKDAVVKQLPQERWQPATEFYAEFINRENERKYGPAVTVEIR